MDIRELQTAILEGEFDDYMDSIREAMNGRREILGRQKFHALDVGDRVTICNVGRPRYINGATGTIKEKRVTKISVLMDENLGDHDPYGKWAGRICIVSPNQIEPIEDEQVEGTVIELPVR